MTAIPKPNQRTTWTQTETTRKAALAGRAAGILQHLPARERRIIELRADRATRQQVADHLGLRPERIRQLEAQANERIATAVDNTPIGFHYFERFGS